MPSVREQFKTFHDFASADLASIYGNRLAAAMRLISVKADAMSAAGPASPMALPAPGIQNSSVAVVGGLYKLSSVLYHGSKGNFSFNP